jgi:AcrR family transcriptional regulator
MSIVTHGRETRRHAILRRAASALQRESAGSASIQSVIDEAGLSHREVVDEFGDRDSLVIALTEMFADSMLEPLDDGERATFQERLVAFGHRVMDMYAAPQTRALYRIAIAGAGRNTDLATAFYSRGPGRVTAGLAHFFLTQSAAGLGTEDDGVHLAGSLMAALRARFDPLDTTHSGSPQASPHDRQRASQIVELFCSGIQRETIDARVAR